MAAMALDKAGIDPDAQLCTARDAAVPKGEHNQLQGPALVKPDDEEIVYEITFDTRN
jgi:hypothetical protein